MRGMFGLGEDGGADDQNYENAGAQLQVLKKGHSERFESAAEREIADGRGSDMDEGPYMRNSPA